MRDLSQHILDLAQNSMTAGATLVIIRLCIEESGTLGMTIADNGRGMSEAVLHHAADPFVTTKQGRRIGLGLSLMQANAERAGGSMQVQSTEGAGTTLTVTMNRNHIDCLPLGDLEGTLLALSFANPSAEIRFEGSTAKGACVYDTRKVKQKSQEQNTSAARLMAAMQQELHQSLNSIFGGGTT
ncbi:MAG: ATP-binding protein [Clostridia bacterium]|nr:ATP-binding protein [Clostridia bacterium]